MEKVVFVFNEDLDFFDFSAATLSLNTVKNCRVLSMCSSRDF